MKPLPTLEWQNKPCSTVDCPPPPDATIIACFGDPGLEAAREVLHGPVLGIAEAASHMASIRVSSFSVITTLSRTCRMTEHLLQK